MGPGNWYEWREQALILHLRVQPRAQRDLIDGLHGQRLRVRLQAPPVDDQANEALVLLLSKSFGVPRHAVSLLQGDKRREKTVRIQPGQPLPDWFVLLAGAVAAPASSL